MIDTIVANLPGLAQIEAIGGTYEQRAQFLEDLTLDPPSATGDYAGPPHLDEDWLVISTIHSAKGQEWRAVFVLDVIDGRFLRTSASGRPISSRRSAACSTSR